MTECVECGAEVSLHENLEVVGIDPVELDTAPELEEDWGE